MRYAFTRIGSKDNTYQSYAEFWLSNSITKSLVCIVLISFMWGIVEKIVWIKFYYILALMQFVCCFAVCNVLWYVLMTFSLSLCVRMVSIIFWGYIYWVNGLWWIFPPFAWLWFGLIAFTPISISICRHCLLVSF